MEPIKETSQSKEETQTQPKIEKENQTKEKEETSPKIVQNDKFKSFNNLPFSPYESSQFYQQDYINDRVEQRIRMQEKVAEKMEQGISNKDKFITRKGQEQFYFHGKMEDPHMKKTKEKYDIIQKKNEGYKNINVQEDNYFKNYVDNVKPVTLEQIDQEYFEDEGKRLNKQMQYNKDLNDQIINSRAMKSKFEKDYNQRLNDAKKVEDEKYLKEEKIKEREEEKERDYKSNIQSMKDEDYYNCRICEYSYIESAMFLPECNIHYLCKRCTKNYYEEIIDEGNKELFCPFLQCKKGVNIEKLKTFISDRKEHKHEAQQDINEIKAGNIREDLPKNK